VSPLTHKQKRSLSLEERRAIAKEIRYRAKQTLKALERAKAIAAAALPCTCGKRYRGHKRTEHCPARKGGENWVKVPPPVKVESVRERLRRRP
jgi:hypothetical protein